LNRIKTKKDKEKAMAHIKIILKKSDSNSMMFILQKIEMRDLQFAKSQILKTQQQKTQKSHRFNANQNQGI